MAELKKEDEATALPGREPRGFPIHAPAIAHSLNQFSSRTLESIW
jgi:hypothetical protein